jgi:formate hydrogenlyase subunit 3/multisubunit Na+/H+ antiporter MnhD subunit
MKVIGYVARIAATTALSSADLGRPRMELVVHAAGGLLVLLVITILSVFKPWGLTRYGRRKLREQRKVSQQLNTVIPAPLGLNIFLTVIGVLVAGFFVLHLSGHILHDGH